MSSATRIQAASLGPELDVHAATVGVVHSVFRRAANLLVDGDLWTLLADDRADLPLGIRVLTRSFDGLGLSRGERVSIRAGFVGIGSRIVVDCRSAPRWSPIRAGAVAPGLERRLAVAVAAGAVRGRSWSGSPAMARAVSESIGDETALSAVLSEVVGRGPGATPSGDDVLVGVFAVLRSAASGVAGAKAAAVLRRLLTPLLPRTTDVSGHLLCQAANGLFSRDVDELVAAIVDPTSTIPFGDRTMRSHQMHSGQSELSPEGAKQDSPGQRPGKDAPSGLALKGRNIVTQSVVPTFRPFRATFDDVHSQGVALGCPVSALWAGSPDESLVAAFVRQVVEAGATSGADMCEGLLALAPSFFGSHREEVSA